MQTPAERFLINAVADFLKRPFRDVPLLLNVGAGTSVVIERALTATGRPYLEDRVDIVDCWVSEAPLRQSFVASVTTMPMLASNSYDLAFANYVLEHVADVRRAADEIQRVLKLGGLFVLSTPNPQAPEFIVSRLTPLWFHQLVKGQGDTAYETHYAYRSIEELIGLFQQKGFQLVVEVYYPFTFNYLGRFPMLNWLSRGYDTIVDLLHLRRLMGNVGLIFQKHLLLDNNTQHV